MKNTQRILVCGVVVLGMGLSTTIWAGVPPTDIEIPSKISLAHLGSIDSFDMTEGGRTTARLLWNALKENRPELAKEAAEKYAELIPKENFGSEYSALQWFCEYLYAEPEGREPMLADPLDREFFAFFGDNDFAVLKEYLERKYRLGPLGEQEATLEANRRLGYLDDFILFNNPRRETWEQTRRLLEVVPVEPGQTIADIGCGPGYYTYRFSQMVGPEGKIFAVDLNDLHITYLSNLVEKLELANIQTVLSRVDDILVNEPVDLAFMCSLYHVTYLTMTRAEKDSFIASIQRVLKPGGALVIVDNSPSAGDQMPYHGPHIAQELIEAQLTHYGFRLESFHQIIPQRYVQVFRLDEDRPPPVEGNRVELDGTRIRVATRRGLIHIPNDSSPQVTVEGRRAALLFHAALELGDRDVLDKARRVYDELARQEQFGDEYTAFSWICAYELADEEDRQKMRRGLNGDYVDLLKGEDWGPLLSYVRDRYRLADEEIEPYRTSGFEWIKKRHIPGVAARTEADLPPPPDGAEVDEIDELLTAAPKPPDPVPPGAEETEGEAPRTITEVAFWRDFILFNNPRREEWEQSSKIIDALNLQPGERVADIGSGPGYYTFQFAERVGEEGAVYAVDTNARHLEFLREALERHAATNIVPVESRFDDCLLEEDTVDTIFMCSLYTIIYTASTEEVKDRFVASMKRALRPGGRLILVDNDLVEDGVMSYHGPYMSRELMIAQMHHYGFELEETHQYIPQRYMLAFRMPSAVEEEIEP